MKSIYCSEFWNAVDQLVATSEIIIDRPAGSCHPRFENVIYPLDYGYLSNTSSMDNSGIDIWRGSKKEAFADALIVTVDLMKRDSEIKLLIGLTEEEKQTVLGFHNDSIYMKGILVNRNPES